MRWKGEGLAAELPYALWADRTTHSSVIGYMPAELMTGQATVMPPQTAITTWIVEAIPRSRHRSRHSGSNTPTTRSVIPEQKPVRHKALTTTAED